VLVAAAVFGAGAFRRGSAVAGAAHATIITAAKAAPHQERGE
jgi:hypothetical protein